MAPPSSQASRPGRILAVLVVLLVVLLASVIGKNAFEPGSWHKGFKVGLGLDLSSGTTVTLKAVSATKGVPPSQQAMKEAASIMLSRVNGAGFTGAEVQQQGSQYIVVSVPGQGAQKVAQLVGTTALLRFRQVLLEATGYPVATTTPTPTATPSPTASPTASPSAGASASPSASASAGASSTASPTASASPKASASSNGQGQAASAKRIAGTPSGARKAKPTSSASPTPASSGSGTASAAPTASPTPTVTTKLPTTADASGDASLVSKAVQKEFNELNCHDKNWQAKIYGNDPNRWDNPNAQVVACDSSGTKYALDKAHVTGTMLTKASAGLDSTSGSWVVNFNLNGGS